MPKPDQRKLCDQLRTSADRTSVCFTVEKNRKDSNDMDAAWRYVTARRLIARIKSVQVPALSVFRVLQSVLQGTDEAG